MNNMIMIIIAVILGCISLVVFALALLANVLGWTQLEEILLQVSFVGSSMAVILMLFGVFIIIIFDLLNYI